MFVRKCLVLFHLLGLITFSNAQKYIGLNVDNDLYFKSDRYYTSGIFVEYGKLTKKSADSLYKWNYISKHWTIGQEINTPSLGSTSLVSKMDYPYNGWLYLGYRQEFFQNADFGYGLGFQIGTTGASESLAEFFQNTYHVNVLNLEPLTWAVSIPQAFHVNINGSFFWGRFLTTRLKWVNHNSVQLGSFRNTLKTRIGIQSGSIQGLPFFGNRLEALQNGISFFLGTELEYSLHDYSLTGSWLKDNNPFSLIPNKFRNIYQVGFIYQSLPWKANIMLNRSSNYIKNQNYSSHFYLKISLHFFI